MAQVPSFYFGDFLQSQQTMADTYSMFPDPYMSTTYSSHDSIPDNSIPSYSPSNYHQGFSHSTTPAHSLEGRQQSVYSGPYQCPSLNTTTPSSPHDPQRDHFYRTGESSTPNVTPNMTPNMTPTQSINPKILNHFDKRYPSDELDEHLNELPLESLLQITHHEGQLINESEADAIRTSAGASSEMCNLPISQDSTHPSSSFYPPNSRNFYLEADLEEDDSGSCLSSSTMYSISSPPEAGHPTPSLNHSFDHSNNHSSAMPSSIATAAGSPCEVPAFRDTSVPNHSYTPDGNTSSPNSCSAYPNPNCSIANNSFFSSTSHMPPPLPEQVRDYTQDRADYRQDIPSFDCEGNYNNQYPPLNSNQVKKNGEPHHVNKKTKLIEKSSKLPSEMPKNSNKKHKMKDSACLGNQTPYGAETESSSDDSSRLIEDLDRRNGKNAEKNTNRVDSSMNFSSNNVFVPPVQPHVEPKKTKTPRKRMRCPRGMTLEKKPCDVCGDTAKNMHFGGLVCDSCKAFFRRSVQSSTWDQFKCEKEENCVITKANRRSCQYCRFRKCERVGMQMEWVMTESGRMNLLKSRLAKTRQIKEEKEKDQVYGDLPRSLEQEDAVNINRILSTLHSTCRSMPYPKECVGDSIDTLSNIFVFLCKRFGKFFLRITEETDICHEDKTLLLKNGIAMSLYINGAHMYDPVSKSWPAGSTHESVKVPRVTLETLQKLADIPDAFSTIMKFYHSYESDLKDHVIAALMYLISFFMTEDPNFFDVSCVQKVQDEYIGYLRRYLIARDGYQSVTGIFLKLMDGLSYVKDILKFHTMVDIKPTINHTEQISYPTKSSMTQSMTSLIHQIQESLKGNFPPYASVLDEEERETLSIFNNPSSCLALSKTRGKGPVMQNHPDTIAIFGSTTRTDMLITQPLQNMIEWQKEKNYSVTLSPLSDGTDNSCISKYLSESDASSSPAANDNYDVSLSSVLTPSSNLLEKRSEREEEMVVSQEVDVDAVCDILKQLSHTDDVKVFSILKENIPRELFEKFSRSLSEDES